MDNVDMARGHWASGKQISKLRRGSSAVWNWKEWVSLRVCGLKAPCLPEVGVPAAEQAPGSWEAEPWIFVAGVKKKQLPCWDTKHALLRSSSHELCFVVGLLLGMTA